ncbi:MAG: UDP-2,4-diacetamido-2,4,6-trideoxy-beta-L-altropyranose hydrolase [Aquificaceae bacterium]|nr:UDP-2,4-diacetamido-2,4,6-trideoxy-beta-L-altropyranose hydrolase [Aquificaceae bacterium]
MRVLFLTEGSSSIGHGHVTRCLSLYDAFKAFGLRPHMFIQGDQMVSSLLQGVSHELYPWLEDWDSVRKRLRDFHVVVVDSYLAGREIYEDVSKSVHAKLFVDDYQRLSYPPGFVLNGSVYGGNLLYPHVDGVKYLTGPEYVPLRKAFWKVGKKTIRKRLRKVFVSFGGDDARSTTPKVIKLLRESYPELELFVVVGKGFKNKEEIYGLVDERVKVFEGLSGEEMKNLMSVVDVAVSAGGQTTYELARVGVPSVLVSVADNQLLNCKGWEKAGFAFYAGWWEDKELWQRLLESVEKLKDYELRLKMSKIGRKLIDGKGALRVVRKLLKAYTENTAN